MIDQARLSAMSAFVPAGRAVWDFDQLDEDRKRKIMASELGKAPEELHREGA